MTRYIYCTAPDGTVLKRRTLNDYAFAVLAKGKDGAWTLENCSRSRQGAQKAVSKLQGLGYRTAIVPVRETKEEAPSRYANRTYRPSAYDRSGSAGR